MSFEVGMTIGYFIYGLMIVGSFAYWVHVDFFRRDQIDSLKSRVRMLESWVEFLKEGRKQ